MSDLEILSAGEQGDNGLSAYAVALQNGFVGTEEEWLASLQPLPLAPTYASEEEAVQDGVPLWGIFHQGPGNRYVPVLGKFAHTGDGTFTSPIAAIRGGVTPGSFYLSRDGTLEIAKPLISRLAVIGDSLVAGGASRAGDLFASFYGSILQYADYRFLIDYPDFARNSGAHAEGGYMSNRAPAAATEVAATERANRADAAFLHFGPNDIPNGVPVATYIANMSAAVAILQDAGVFPFVLTICAGDGAIVGGTTPRSTRVAEFNEALITAFGGREDVKVIDCRAVLEQSPGLAKPFYSQDGVHLTFNATKLWAKEIVAQLMAGGYLGEPRNMFHGVIPINKNPYLMLATGGVRPFTGGTNTMVRAARTDGKQYLGEMEATITLDHGTPTIGAAGANAVTYTLKVPGTEAYVEHYADPLANATLTAEMRSCNTLRVNLRRNANYAILSTPAEIQAVVNAFGASPYTAAANGSGTASFGMMPHAEYWTAIEAPDEPVTIGDQVRVVVQIKPAPGYEFKLRNFGGRMWSSDADGISTLWSNMNFFSELYIPINAEGVITFVSPWATLKTVNAATQQLTTPALFLSYSGTGRFVLMRPQLQKRAAGIPFIS